MKHLLLACFLFVFTANIQAQAPVTDTVVFDRWNGTDWGPDYRSIFSYDVDCRLATTLSQGWNAGSSEWRNQSLTTYSYLTDNYISEAITQSWSNGTSTWNNLSRTAYTYDGSYKILTLSTQAWNNNAWKDVTLLTYSYDSNGYPDSALTQFGFIGPLENFALSIYTNNPDGTPSLVVNQAWSGTSWQNLSRTTFTYNPDKTVSQAVTESWLGVAWQNSERLTYTYNTSGKMLSVLAEQWDGTQWGNSSQTINTYDGNDYLTNTLDQSWDGTTWVNSEQTSYVNNSDGTVHQSVSQFWGLGATEWSNDTRTTYSYTTSCTLPLKLLVFNASRKNNEVTLNWQTTEEINSSHFTVQRSSDGINFSSRGTVNAKGNSAADNYYGFTDNIDKVVGDKIYYRLQMADKDGSFVYSKIVPVTLDVYAGKIKTYPNPVKDQLYILFNMQNATKAELRITDAAGKIVHVQRLATAQTNNAISVNVAALPKGTYFIQVVKDKGVQKTQFIKQ
jgi:Secretion system C-terminal sorting domain